MDIKKTIISSDSFGSSEGKEIALKLINSPASLPLFIEGFLGDDIRYRQRAAWVLVALANNHEEVLNPYLKILSAALLNSSEDSVKRNILRIFQHITLPQSIHEQMINYCFEVLASKEEAIAIQVFAMSVLKKLITNYPELRRELSFILEERLPYASAGYKARAKTIITALNKKGDLQ
ncbi:MAG: hypothetical protein ACJAT1_000816 [Marivirga sp.]